MLVQRNMFRESLLENNLLRFTFPFLVRRAVSTAFVRVVRVSFMQSVRAWRSLAGNGGHVPRLRDGTTKTGHERRARGLANHVIE